MKHTTQIKSLHWQLNNKHYLTQVGVFAGDKESTEYRDTLNKRAPTHFR
ncbi:hypothetical protein [Paenibacillus allorhizoplanae]|nr:hypothetical protein [Paenibacillus allorhizoplanae]